MKLIIQIPCLNEEKTLPATIKGIPREIKGIDCIEILVIDDGCTDRTVAVAREMGVDHIVRFSGNRGLGHAFAAGIDRCLMLGADIIVNTDGDNQYAGSDIPKLVEPILTGQADIVIGNRQPDTIAHFSLVKKKLQIWGSRVVSKFAGIAVPDVASGFRAYSREAAMSLVYSTDFDHTVDHVIQAGRRRIITKSVPVGTNEKFRESRLFSSIWGFVFRSLGIMLRVYSSYRAMKIFATAGIVTASLGLLLGLRFLYIYFFITTTRDLHIQSLILAAILLLAGFQMILTGIVADLINSSRVIIEDVSYRIRRLELKQSIEDSVIIPRQSIEKTIHGDSATSITETYL
jgi:glycosyltransferase involved in cell wall biosynthesis